MEVNIDFDYLADTISHDKFNFITLTGDHSYAYTPQLDQQRNAPMPMVLTDLLVFAISKSGE